MDDQHPSFDRGDASGAELRIEAVGQVVADGPGMHASDLTGSALQSSSVQPTAAIGSTSMATFDAVDDRLRRWIARHRRVFALTGAGCSTASGIPDYRDDQGEWKRRPPVMIQAFRTQDAVYRRYWARAYAGWPRFTTAAPNAAHRAFAAWERAGTLRPARHAERRPPAPARRQPRRPRPPRPSRRRRLPRLRRTHQPR